MIERPEDLKVFGQGFCGSVTVDGRASGAVFSRGADRERTLRGTVISDNRSFLVGVIPWAREGSEVRADGRDFVIEEIQQKAGIITCFLKLDRKGEVSESDYYPH